MDDRVYMQQIAGATKVGYNAYYEYKMAREIGLSCSSGHEESLSAGLGQGKGHGRLAQNPRVNRLLAKAIT